MRRILRLFHYRNIKYLPRLLWWELFSPTGLMGSFTLERRLRSDVQHEFDQLFPVRGRGYFSRYDWQRLEMTLHLITGESILDIGPYNGAFLHMVKSLGKFKRIDALDIVRHPFLKLPENSRLELCDVANMNLADASYDTVTATEIIEHLPPENVEKALANMRRVAKRRIIFSVPFKEAFPLFKQGHPNGHQQRFDEEKILKMSPYGFYMIVQAGLGAPWILIVEDNKIKSKNDEFRVHTLEEIKKILAQ